MDGQVLFLDFNVLDFADGQENAALHPMVAACLGCGRTNPFVFDSDKVAVVILPVSSMVSPQETLFLEELQKQKLSSRRLVVQLSSPVPWSSPPACLAHALLVWRDQQDGWSKSFAGHWKKDLFLDTQASFAGSLRGTNRHLLAEGKAAGRCYGQHLLRALLSPVLEAVGAGSPVLEASEPGSLVILELEAAQGQLLQLLLDEGEKFRGSWVGGCIASQARSAALSAQVAAHADALTRRSLHHRSSDTGDELAALATKVDGPLLTPPVPGELSEFVSATREAAAEAAEEIGEPWWSMGGSSSLVFTPADGPVPEAKACRKALAREASPMDKALAMMPASLSLQQSLSRSAIALFPSLVSDSMAVYATRRFLPGETVLEVAGDWRHMQA